MASTASAALRLELMATGENDGTWGAKHNTNMEMLESGVVGTEDITLGSSDVTLTDSDFTNDQSKKRILFCTGTLTGNVNIIAPNRARLYYVVNNTSGAFTVGFKTAVGSAKEITQGASADMYVDGADGVLFLGCETVIGTGGPATAAGAAASSIEVTPTGNLTSTDAQAAFGELQGDVDTINTGLANKQPLDADLTAIAALLNTKGNIISGSGASWTALAAGTNGYVIIADSVQSSGLRYTIPYVPDGSLALFQQNTAPTGYTKQSTHDDKAVRVTSQTAGSGGLTPFSTIFASRLPTGTIGGTSITEAQMASHSHMAFASGNSANALQVDWYSYMQSNTGTQNQHYVIKGAASLTADRGQTNTIGSDATHNHSFTANAIDFETQYVDLIIAQKDNA